MIDALCDALKPRLPEYSVLERVDMAIALMVVPITPATELANLCLENVARENFVSGWYQLFSSTNCCKRIAEKDLHYIEENDLCVGMINRYLHGSNQKISETLVRDNFMKITQQIIADRYDAKNDDIDESGWSDVALSTCGKNGPVGPDLNACINTYNTAWSKNKALFNVDDGIQKLTIPKTGIYEINAKGAGYNKSSGACILGRFELLQGDILQVVVGQIANSYQSIKAGNGGTFVVKGHSQWSLKPLIIAGGAGGHNGNSITADWCNANLKLNGNAPYGELPSDGQTNNCSVGSSGFSGRKDCNNGGAGYFTDPILIENKESAQCFASGMKGGLYGGFGGGGSGYNGCGGGGGYSGGHGSIVDSTPGGGGSFCSDENATFELGWCKAGSCKIKFIPVVIPN